MNSCRVCSKAFSSRTNMARHLIESHGAPTYHCDVCDATFRRKDYLEKHSSSRACKGTHLDNHPKDQHGGARYERTLSESSSSNNQEMSHEEGADEGDSERQELDTENESNQEDYEMSDAREDSEHSSDDDEEESWDSDDVSRDAREDYEHSSDDYDEEESMDSGDDVSRDARESDSHFKYFGFARYGKGCSALYVAWKSRRKIPYVVQHREWLRNLRNSKPEWWRQRLNEATDSQLEAFREMAYNVMRGRVAMHLQAIRGMMKNWEEIGALSHEGNSYEQLRYILKKGRVGVLLRLLLWALPDCIKSHKATYG